MSVLTGLLSGVTSGVLSGVTGGGDAPFDPSDIEGLAWYHGNDNVANIPTDGDGLTAWKDKTGTYGELTRVNAANSPDHATYLGDKKAVTFNDTDYLDLPADLYSTISQGDNTVIVVWKTDTPNAQQRLINGFVGSSTRWGLIYSQGTSDLVGVNATTFNSVSPEIIEDALPHFDYMRRDGNFLKVGRDEYFSETEAFATDVTLGSGRLGARLDGFEGLSGVILDIFVVPRAITDEELESLRQYCYTYWEFEPSLLSVSGVVGLFDASVEDGHTLSGTNVVQANDLSGNSNHMPVTGDVFTGTRTENGNNTWDLDGSTGGFIMPSDLYDLPQNDYTLIVVASRDVKKNSYLMVMDDNTLNHPQFRFDFAGDTFRVQSGSGQSNKGITFDTDTHLFGLVREGVGVIGYYDGVANGAAAIASDRTCVSGTLGCGNNDGTSFSFFHDGTISAAVYLNKAITEFERSYIEFTFNQKWKPS